MNLPIFNIMEGFVQDIDASAVETITPIKSVFIYDTTHGDEIGILCEDGRKLAESLGSMARLMGIPCMITITYIQQWERKDSAAAFRVVVRLPYHLRRDVVEEEMEMNTYFGVVTVGFKELKQLTDAMMDGK